MHSWQMSCRIVTGGRGEGKTTLMKELALRSQKPQGFLSIHENDSYNLFDLVTGEKVLLMTERPLLT